MNGSFFLRHASGEPADSEPFLAASPRLLVFDFDGTLAHLALTPEKAALTTAVRGCLEKLASSPATTVSVLSGRALADVTAKIDLPGLIYFGSHGLTSNRSDLAMAEELLRLWTERARDAERILAPLVLKYPGCLLEHKGPDVCLHHRGVDRNVLPHLLREARRRLAGFPHAVKEGKGVLEARPPGTGKGDAVLLLIKTFLPGFPRKGLCLYAGDDLTDEDAFSALEAFGGRACTIKVGPGETRARFRLDGVAEIEKLLRTLADGGLSGGSNEKVKREA